MEAVSIQITSTYSLHSVTEIGVKKDPTTNSGLIFDAEFENHSHFSPTRTDFS